jgi:hypothetical protein
MRQTRMARPNDGLAMAPGNMVTQKRRDHATQSQSGVIAAALQTPPAAAWGKPLRMVWPYSGVRCRLSTCMVRSNNDLTMAPEPLVLCP